jgi:3D (Asp-Asp-Asp) domain-containing protein
MGQPLRTLTIEDTMRMWATWYNPASAGRSASSAHYGVTATGVQVTRGVVAVDPAVIPLGSRLYIPGYGFAVAADTGGGIIGNMVDLGFEDGSTVDWRTGWVDVYLLGP